MMPSVANLIESSALQFVEFPFPSKGVMYPDRPTSVMVRPTTTEEEKFLRTIVKNDPQLDVKMSRYIDAITNLRELNMSANDLTTGDQLAILIYSRIISNGLQYYPTKVTCPNCEANELIDVDILKLKIDELPDSYEEPAELNLEEHSLTLGMRILRVFDKIELKQWHKEIRKAGLKLEGIADDAEGLYARSITTVKKSGDEVNLVFSQKRELLTKMPTPSMNKIVNWHNDHYHGYVFETPFTCSQCGYESEDPIPFELAADFFFLKPTKKEQKSTGE